MVVLCRNQVVDASGTMAMAVWFFLLLKSLLDGELFNKLLLKCRNQDFILKGYGSSLMSSSNGTPVFCDAITLIVTSL